jgi:hypothetical protein
MCIIMAAKTRGIFTIGFYQEGTVYLESSGEENGLYDEIGARLEIKKLQTEEKEFIKTLQLWYILFKTEEGKLQLLNLKNK